MLLDDPHFWTTKVILGFLFGISSFQNTHFSYALWITKAGNNCAVTQPYKKEYCIITSESSNTFGKHYEVWTGYPEQVWYFVFLFKNALKLQIFWFLEKTMFSICGAIHLREFSFNPKKTCPYLHEEWPEEWPLHVQWDFTKGQRVHICCLLAVSKTMSPLKLNSVLQRNLSSPNC